MNFDNFLTLYNELISESIHEGNYINEMPLSSKARINIIYGKQRTFFT